jgi:hypothetical protein
MSRGGVRREVSIFLTKFPLAIALSLGRVDNIWEGYDVWAKAITP